MPDISPCRPKVSVAAIEGKGRGLVAAEPLTAGEIVLRESPILLYTALAPTLPQTQPPDQSSHSYCSFCFRSLHSHPNPPFSCPSCSISTPFCSSHCQSLALSSSHSPWACQALQRLRDVSSPLLLHPNQDLRIQAVFLVAAYNLAVVSPSDFRKLLSLHGDSSSICLDDAAPFLHSVISSLSPPVNNEFGCSLELTAALLVKDKLNAFGLMEPFSPDRERSVRAYGIYLQASFFNHDCLPNACRFDYVDSGDQGFNADIIVRAIHDVPSGREICLSYFPVNLKFSERQSRLKEDYGFSCCCDRCMVEANWSDDEKNEGQDEEGSSFEVEQAMDEDVDEAMASDLDLETEDCRDGGEETDFPHAYFFLRYMCDRENCFGTLAPLPPTNGTPSSVMECNVCGNLINCQEQIEGGS